MRIVVQKRMAPILQLNDIGLERQRANSRGIALNDDAAAAARDDMRMPAVDRRFEQHEGLLDMVRQRASDRRMGLADATAKVRCNVKNSHAAASVTTPPGARPPGATTVGSGRIVSLNLASSASR